MYTACRRYKGLCGEEFGSGSGFLENRELVFRTIDPMVVIAAGLHNGVAGVLSADLLRQFRWYPFGPIC